MRRWPGKFPSDKMALNLLCKQIADPDITVYGPWVDDHSLYLQWLNAQPKPMTCGEYWLTTNAFGEIPNYWGPETVVVATAPMVALITVKGRRADASLPMGVSRTVSGNFIAHYHDLETPRRSRVFYDEIDCHFDWLKNRIRIIGIFLEDNKDNPIIVRWANKKMARMQDCLDRNVVCKER